MSDVIIKYNNKRVPNSGNGPTPYLSLADATIRHGDRWGLSQSISLNGVISGCDFDDLYSAQTGLVGIFADSYKTIEVLEGADGQGNESEVFSFSGCVVNGISFTDSPYNRVVNYSVNLTSYPSGYTGYFSGTFGVLDPSDSISISENDNGTASLVRDVSARGFVTTTVDDAINNAKNYVNNRTGISDVLTVNQISGFENSSSFTPVLVSVAENLDRLSLTYSIRQEYAFSMLTGDAEAANNYSFNNYYLTSYSTNLASGAGDDFVRADIRGSIKAGVTGEDGDALIASLTEKLSELDPYSVISGKYGDPNNLSFCQDPISFSVDQNLKDRSISFAASYDNLEFYSYADGKYVYGNAFLDASINHDIDDLTKVQSITVEGQIKVRGSVENRFAKAETYLNKLLTSGTSTTEPRLFDFANDYYTSYVGGGYKLNLNQKPTNVAVNANRNLGIISVEATFDNADRFEGLSETNYSISFAPYNTLYAYNFSSNDSLQHLAVDIGVQRRERAQINLSLGDSSDAKSRDDLISSVKNLTQNASTSFYNQFPVLLAADGTIQEELSNLSVNNTTLSDTTFRGVVSAEKTYSYELGDISNRRVVKS